VGWGGVGETSGHTRGGTGICEMKIDNFKPEQSRERKKKSCRRVAYFHIAAISWRTFLFSANQAVHFMKQWFFAMQLKTYVTFL
jgi:hypothetical protein